MNSTEIRQSFFDFFKEKGHQIVPSASLLPTAPNLLFTNAGMNQFVPHFLDERPAAHSRIADTQKCIRAGGKHNDLDDVGLDTYHHTFFEMLGNWSFGDYFKKEAIEWAWELLTEVWGFPKERLYATVYQPAKGDPAEFDQEAWDYWAEVLTKSGLDPKKHIQAWDKKDNFWMMGDTGPCGPCSEIHMDLTPDGNTGGCLVNKESPLCIEIWNLVFIQFNAGQDGSFKPLSARHVDTGLGFERVAGIIATTKNFTDFSNPPSNYDCDLFTDIFQQLEKMSGHRYSGTIPNDPANMSEVELKDCSFRVLADHIRTLSCSIADGILPANEGRNYVLRRILRRAVLFARHLDLPASSFVKLADPVEEKLGSVFPELVEHREVIRRVIASEEEAFERTIGRGLQMLEKITEGNSGIISGKDAFQLYDTYGFPIDLTQLIARERHLKVDLEGFAQEMEKQRARGRAAQKKTAIEVSEDDLEIQKTEFVGFEEENLTNHPTELLDRVEADGKSFLVFRQTPFYAEMGGQLGDTGVAEIEDYTIRIRDTIRDDSGRYLHLMENLPAVELVGKPAQLTVDLPRRKAIQRHHSATHVLHWALRQVLGTHVRQAGSLVAEDRLRFDFAHFEAPGKEKLQQIELLANQRLLENAAIDWHEIPFAQKPENVIAFFGEKYGEIVRVVDIGGWSVELCGGTHVRATGEIGLLKIVHESAIAAGTRRVEAVVGESAISLIEKNFLLISNLAHQLTCPPAELSEKLFTLLDQRKSQEEELRNLRGQGTATLADKLAHEAKNIGSLKWVVAKVEVANPGDLRKLAVTISKKTGPGVIVLGAVFGHKATLLSLCSNEAIVEGHKAGEIIRDLSGKLGGKGGGKPDFAMGGGNDINALDEALQSLLKN